MTTPSSSCRGRWRSDIAGESPAISQSQPEDHIGSEYQRLGIHSQLDIAYIATDVLVALALVVRTMLSSGSFSTTHSALQEEFILSRSNTLRRFNTIESIILYLVKFRKRLCS